MKRSMTILFLCLSLHFSAQEHGEFKNCETQNCKITTSYTLAKQFLEADNIQESQKWLNKTKDLHFQKKRDTTDCFINSLQSELFYYMGMFQFGATEAHKGLETALKLKDSLLIADVSFFEAINEFELKNYKQAEKLLWLSRDYFPKKILKDRMSYTIQNEHIYNNISQLKLKLNQIDSALYYNEKAYAMAKNKISKRGIPNAEQTFGQIYLQQKSVDSSLFYFGESLKSALEFEHLDIALLNYGFLMMVNQNKSAEKMKYFNEGILMMQKNEINSFYRLNFYENALNALENSNEESTIIDIQKQIININSASRLNTNSQIQDISSQYVRNENKLLSEEAESLRKQRNITVLLIISALLCICILVLSMAIIRRKNNERKRQELIQFESIMEGQEKERKRIASDLHDGLNGELSAIKFRVLGLEDQLSDAADKEQFQNIISMIDQSCAQVRRISHDLMPASIEEFGLIEALHQYCKKLNQSQKIEIDFQTFGIYKTISKHHESTLYRIIQELLFNVVKHSGAKNALVQINFHEDDISVVVEDDGHGFDTQGYYDGIGLKNLHSRVELLGGSLDIKSSEKGTYAHIIFAINKLIND